MVASSALALSSLVAVSITLSGCGGQSCLDYMNANHNDIKCPAYCDACGDCSGESGDTNFGFPLKEACDAGAQVCVVLQQSCSSRMVKLETVAEDFVTKILAAKSTESVTV